MFSADYQNPFLPPPMKSVTLKKIKNCEFVDFEVLVISKSSRAGNSSRRRVRFVFDDETLQADENGSAPIRAQLDGGDGVIATFANWGVDYIYGSPTRI